MSLKCSLFGHNYSDTERRRSREENGTELVETVREIKACTRCGETLVVSEATEVTTIRGANATGREGADTDRRDGTGAGQGDRADTDRQDGAETRPQNGADTTRRDRPDTGQHGGTDRPEGEIRERTTEPAGQQDGQSTGGQHEEQIKQINTQGGGRTDTPRGGEGTSRNGVETGATAVGQGAVDGEAEPSDTDTSDRSESDRPGVAASGHAGDTDTVETADTRSREGTDTDRGTKDAPPSRKNDAFIIDEDGEERRPTEWPGTGHEDGDDTADVEDWEPDVDTGNTDTPPEPAARSTTGHTVPEGEFYCPECEFTTLVKFASSLREGDFCPECHRAALEYRSE